MLRLWRPEWRPTPRPNPTTLYIIDSRQLSSSDQSPQWSYPLHRLQAGRHTPVLRHLNWSTGHATHTHMCLSYVYQNTYLLTCRRPTPPRFPRLHCSLRWDHERSLVFTCGRTNPLLAFLSSPPLPLALEVGSLPSLLPLDCPSLPSFLPSLSLKVPPLNLARGSGGAL